MGCFRSGPLCTPANCSQRSTLTTSNFGAAPWMMFLSPLVTSASSSATAQLAELLGYIVLASAAYAALSSFPMTFVNSFRGSEPCRSLWARW